MQCWKQAVYNNALEKIVLKERVAVSIDICP